MNWLLALLILLLLAGLAFFLIRGRGATDDRTAESGTGDGTPQNPLEHERDGLNRPLPGQRARVEGEVHDAAREHVGAHLESDAAAGGTPTGDGADARRSPDAGPDAATVAKVAGAAASRVTTGGDDVHRVEASVRTQPPVADDEPAGVTPPEAETETVRTPAPALDADEAALAARDARDSGGTGAAVLAGVAVAGGAADAIGTDDSASAEHADAADGSGRAATGSEGRSGSDDDTARTHGPDPDSAGAFDPSGRDGRGDRASGDAAERGADGTAGGDGTSAAPPGSDVPAEAEPDDQSVRDNAATNAPIADADPGESARTPVGTPAPATPSDTAARADDDRTDGAATDERGGASGHDATAARANPPEDAAAGDLDHRDRSSAHRSNLVAGTVTLAVGGATAAAGAAVLEDGRTPESQSARLRGDGDHPRDGATRGADETHLRSGDTRRDVREMIKILNLAEGDAVRLGVSADDFARLRRGEEGASETLVDEVSARLRRMLG